MDVPVRPSRGRPVPRARFLRSVVSVRSFGSAPVSRLTQQPAHHAAAIDRAPAQAQQLRVGERGHQPLALRVHAGHAQADRLRRTGRGRLPQRARRCRRPPARTQQREPVLADHRPVVRADGPTRHAGERHAVPDGDARTGAQIEDEPRGAHVRPVSGAGGQVAQSPLPRVVLDQAGHRGHGRVDGRVGLDQRLGVGGLPR